MEQWTVFMIPRDEWRDQAACRSSDVDFFDVRHQSAALKVCGGCESLLSCRRWAINAEPVLAGCVVGGMTPGALRLARRLRKKEN